MRIHIKRPGTNAVYCGTTNAYENNVSKNYWENDATCKTCLKLRIATYETDKFVAGLGIHLLKETLEAKNV